ncbi:MAG TPA: hypothetical protein VM367_17435 [Pseudonocardia sp.]|nr:hypothetical protein [Pseudonocardia sp.]
MTDPAHPDLDAIADELYRVHPDEFVPARDEAVRGARERGDRELARAVGRLRKPTRAAWLANLLTHERAGELDALLALAPDLADAQRALDGAALRAMSARRQKLVRAMAQEAGRLGRAAGDPVGEGLLREVQGVLDAALVDPGVAEQLRAGRLTRAVSYAGFGPGATIAGGGSDPGSGTGSGAAATRGTGTRPGRADPDRPEREGAEHEPAEHERARVERERAERERARAESRRALAEAEEAAAAARTEQDAADAARDAAHRRDDESRERVAALSAELEEARRARSAAAENLRAATEAARTAARTASGAAARAQAARAALDGLT